ncbi:MAG TPA: YceI family protein [Opitutaceae bacterium]|nr:YceI family protein [Opitutaceae bacterium]
MKRLLVLFTATALALTASAAVETYKFDPAHSSVAFTVRHVFSQVPGSFAKVQGTIVVDREHMTKSSVDVTIDVTSLTTNNEKRDNHLRSDAFFDVAKFPTATFKSTSWTEADDDVYDVAGDLTIKGVTKPTTIHVMVLGFGPGMAPGTMVSGWRATVGLKRSDFGVNGPAMLGKAIGDDVVVTADVEADLVKSETPAAAADAPKPDPAKSDAQK